MNAMGSEQVRKLDRETAMKQGRKTGQSGPLRIALNDALGRLPGPDGKRFAGILDEGRDLEVEIYAPRGVDPQMPHRRDELYVVVSGSGFFRAGDLRERFGPGDLLLAPAGAVHRFEEFSDDLVVWVMFYGPEK
jgi:mannose-6-phosphate isomerase-like protein (cupin superfamily)